MASRENPQVDGGLPRPIQNSVGRRRATEAPIRKSVEGWVRGEREGTSPKIRTASYRARSEKPKDDGGPPGRKSKNPSGGGGVEGGDAIKKSERRATRTDPKIRRSTAGCLDLFLYFTARFRLPGSTRMSHVRESLRFFDRTPSVHIVGGAEAGPSTRSVGSGRQHPH
jgi:hypothetical protein